MGREKIASDPIIKALLLAGLFISTLLCYTPTNYIRNPTWENFIMFAELFALGVMFWVGALLAIVIICAMVDTDSLWWPFVVIIAGAALVEFVHDASLLATAKTWTPVGVAESIVLWLAIGFGVFAIKWGLFMKERKERYMEVKSEFIGEYGRIDSKSMKEKFACELRRQRVLSSNETNITPMARNYKRRIGAWIVWWPATLLNAIFRDLARHLYYMVRGLTDKVSIRYFASTEKDFESLGK
jgi:hypothetical protein